MMALEPITMGDQEALLTLTEAENFLKPHNNDSDSVTYLSAIDELRNTKPSICTHTRESEEDPGAPFAKGIRKEQEYGTGERHNPRHESSPFKNECEHVPPSPSNNNGALGSNAGVSFRKWTGGQEQDDDVETTISWSSSAASSSDEDSVGYTTNGSSDDLNHEADDDQAGTTEGSSRTTVQEKEGRMVVLIDMQEYRNMQAEMSIMRSRLLVEQNKVAKLMMMQEQQRVAVAALLAQQAERKKNNDSAGESHHSDSTLCMSTTLDEMDIPPTTPSTWAESSKSTKKKVLRKMNMKVIMLIAGIKT
jgi:hypothetical protein